MGDPTFGRVYFKATNTLYRDNVISGELRAANVEKDNRTQVDLDYEAEESEESNSDEAEEREESNSDSSSDDVLEIEEPGVDDRAGKEEKTAESSIRLTYRYAVMSAFCFIIFS